MTRHSDNLALSLLYDTLLFAVMVSLSAAVLLPALTDPHAPLASLEKHRELDVDDTLHTLLATRLDNFSYAFLGTITDHVADTLGINTSSQGLYAELRAWTLANTPRHETYAALIAEDLTSQLRIPTGPTSNLRLNILTEDYDTSLQTALTHDLNLRLQGRYHYNLTARWHPITGLALGGDLTVGPPPPHQTSHVATRHIAVPLAPAIRIHNTTITLTHHALAHQLDLINLSSNTTIPQISNLTTILNAYLHHTPPYTTRPPAADAITENLTSLLDAFLIDGIHTTNTTILPGIANVTLDALLARLTQAATNTSLNDTLGALTGTLNHILTGLANTTAPLTSGLLAPLTTSLTHLLNQTANLPILLTTAKAWILNQTRAAAHQLLAPAITTLTDTLLEATDGLHTLTFLLNQWLLDRLAIQTATITLTLWTTHP